MVVLNQEERALEAAIIAMEAARRLAVTDGDVLQRAEIDAWFKQHAPVIRALRDKLEAEEFDRP